MACVQKHRKEYPVVMMCRLLGVSSSRFYLWLSAPKSRRKIEDEKLTAKIVDIFQRSRKIYGSPRIHAALNKSGEKCGRNRVIKLMKQEKICSRVKRKFKVTTDSKHELPVASNVLERQFTRTKANDAWVQDITYIPTKEGWLYLAVVIDLFSRKVVGFSMQDNMRKKLVLDALNMAIAQRCPLPGLIVHSDRGSQYCSELFQSKLKGCEMICSMSAKGECWDNAVAESFFHSLKTEHVYLTRYETKEEASKSIFEYIEVFYNRERLHSTLGFLTPVEYEQKLGRVA